MMSVLLLIWLVCESVPSDEKQKMPSSMVFKLKAEALTPELAAKELSETTGLLGIERVFRDGGRFEFRHRGEGLHLWYKATVPSESGSTAMENLLKRTDLIAKAATTPTARKATPNDPFYDDQPHMRAVGMEEAWAVSAGDPNIVIAIIDSGVDVNHPEMRSNAWLNTGEVCGNGADDDGNGYVDDCSGYNFADNSGTQLLGDDSHGTHCAGCVNDVFCSFNHMRFSRRISLLTFPLH